METLVQHVTQGFKAMPPRGLCMDCSVEDYRAVIQLMSQYPGHNTLTLSRSWIS